MGLEAQAGVFHPVHFTLSNGMNVYLIENHRVDAVAHMLWYRAGAMDEPPGKSGIAHFLEHLMFKGTDALAEGEFSKVLGRLGADHNAFTSWDYTAYYAKIAREHLPTLMQMEADRMQNLQLSEQAVETERSVIIEERKQVIDSNVFRRFYEQVLATLFSHHAYGTPIIGWMHEMTGLNRADALDFYAAHYAPNRAILVVSGAIAEEELRALAEEHYSSIPPADAALSRVPSLEEPPHLAPRMIVMRDPQVELPLWQRSYIVPSYTTGDKKTADALTILAESLARGETGALYEALVYEAGLASSVSVHYDPERRGPATFDLSVVPKDAAPETLEAVIAIVDTVLAGVAENLMEDDRLASLKEGLLTEAVYARDSLLGPAMALGQVVAMGLDPSYVEEWPERIAAVTSKDIKAAAALIDRNQSVEGQLLPL